MSILLPDFKDRKCFEAELCGFMPATEFDQKEEQLPELVEKRMYAEYERSGEKVLVRLQLPFPLDDDGDVHLHVDFLPVRGQKTLPPNADINEILSRLDHFVHTKNTFFLTVKGRFRVAAAELPRYIRPMVEEISGVRGIQVRMTSGTLSLRGAPIQSISWLLLDKEPGAAEMTLEARTKRNLSESYFVEELDKLESAFKAFVTQTD